MAPKREIIYLTLCYHHQNDSCIQMGSSESHFNVSLTVRGRVARQCRQITISDEKGKPERYQTEVLPLTSLPPYRWAKAAHSIGWKISWEVHGGGWVGWGCGREGGLSFFCTASGSNSAIC